MKNLKVLEDKFNKDREDRMKNEIADLVVKKLMEQNNGSLVPTLPQL